MTSVRGHGDAILFAASVLTATASLSCQGERKPIRPAERNVISSVQSDSLPMAIVVVVPFSIPDPAPGQPLPPLPPLQEAKPDSSPQLMLGDEILLGGGKSGASSADTARMFPPNSFGVEPGPYDHLPEALEIAEARYPEKVRGSHIRRLVRVRALIGRDGRVQQTRVTPHQWQQFDEAFDAEAQESVRNWKFRPARKGDQPVAVWAIIEVVFEPRE